MKSVNTINFLLSTKLEGILIFLHALFPGEIIILHFVIFSMIICQNGKICDLHINFAIGQCELSELQKTFRHVTGSPAAWRAFTNLRLMLTTAFLVVFYLVRLKQK